jgi:hypothetical protein
MSTAGRANAIAYPNKMRTMGVAMDEINEPVRSRRRFYKMNIII